MGWPVSIPEKFVPIYRTARRHNPEHSDWIRTAVLYIYIYIYIYMCVCVCVRARARIYVFVYMYLYVWVCVFMYVCMYVCVCLCICIYVCMCVCESYHIACLFQLFLFPFFLLSSRHMAWYKWCNMKPKESSDVPVLIFQTVRCRGADRDINPANEFRNSSSTLCHSPLAPRELVSPQPLSCITFTELSWGFRVH